MKLLSVWKKAQSELFESMCGALCGRSAVTPRHFSEQRL